MLDVQLRIEMKPRNRTRFAISCRDDMSYITQCALIDIQSLKDV